MYKSLFTRIAETVTIPMILNQYGYSEGRNHRAPCPIHHGRDLNMSYTNEVFYCFVCNEGGGIFQLVMKMFGLNVKEAAAKINEDFRLRFTDKKPTRQERRLLQLDKAVNDRIDKCLSREQRILDGMRILHRQLHTKYCNGKLCEIEHDTMNRLQSYLDDNTYAILYPWE